MQSKGKILFLLLTAAVLFRLPMAIAESRSRAALVVEIKPMGYVEAPPSLRLQNAGEATSIRLPILVKVRLSRGAYADLSISREGQIGTGDSKLAVETGGSVSEISATPVQLRRFSQSGVYSDSVALRVSSPVQPESYSIPLRVRLSSNDQTVEWSVPVSVQVVP
jgi:hypothetical protein